MNHQLKERPPPDPVQQQQGILKSQPGVSAKIAADAERLQRRRAYGSTRCDDNGHLEKEYGRPESEP